MIFYINRGSEIKLRVLLGFSNLFLVFKFIYSSQPTVACHYRPTSKTSFTKMAFCWRANGDLLLCALRDANFTQSMYRVIRIINRGSYISSHVLLN